MTNEERDIITHFIERVSGAAPSAPGSVPSAAPALPPIDKEADALIAELFAKYPDAKFRLTQTAFVQEHAMMEAQKRIQALEAELQKVRAQAQAAPAPADAPKSGGFLSGLFGGGGSRPVAPQGAPVWNQGQQAAPQYAPAPAYGQPQYAPPPQYAPAMMQQGGSGFLGSALRTAAGVAGGVVAGNLLMDAFSGHSGAGASLGGFGGGLGGGGVMPSGSESPWASPAAPVGTDPAVDQGGWNTDAGPAPVDSGWTDAPAAPPDGGGWTDSSSDGGGWTDASSGGGGDDSSWT